MIEAGTSLCVFRGCAGEEVEEAEAEVVVVVVVVAESDPTFRLFMSGSPHASLRSVGLLGGFAGVLGSLVGTSPSTTSSGKTASLPVVPHCASRVVGVEAGMVEWWWGGREGGGWAKSSSRSDSAVFLF